ncbi:hypothetical protein [Kitasatospora sp. GP82]|uniref:hypothetical protein n=1 Tax=Kitasatospora sp. GP82 TaxID=3035089 RepID=UPI002475ADD7|nr:hypothetical protein [Kitasatospora sp. GP82]MDH6129402.1 hypothetical protein [Kitasatospora sp. GP82]
MTDDQDLPVTAASITLTTSAEQARDTVILLAEARLGLAVELADGTEVVYHPATALPARPLDAGERAVLDAYGEFPSIALLIRQSAAAFHLWQTAIADSGRDPQRDVERRLAALQQAYVLPQAVALDLASLRDGGDPRTEAECVAAANRLRRLAGLAPEDAREALAWLRYTSGREPESRDRGGCGCHPASCSRRIPTAADRTPPPVGRARPALGRTAPTHTVSGSWQLSRPPERWRSTRVARRRAAGRGRCPRSRPLLQPS